MSRNWFLALSAFLSLKYVLTPSMIDDMARA